MPRRILVIFNPAAGRGRSRAKRLEPRCRRTRTPGLHGYGPFNPRPRRRRAAGARGRPRLRSDRGCRRGWHRQRGGERNLRRVAAAGGAAARHRQRAGERNWPAARSAAARSGDRRRDTKADLAGPRRRPPVPRDDRGWIRCRGARRARPVAEASNRQAGLYLGDPRYACAAIAEASSSSAPRAARIGLPRLSSPRDAFTLGDLSSRPMPGWTSRCYISCCFEGRGGSPFCAISARCCWVGCTGWRTSRSSPRAARRSLLATPPRLGLRWWRPTVKFAAGCRWRSRSPQVRCSSSNPAAASPAISGTAPQRRLFDR